MDDDQRMMIEHECERLVMRYCHLVDGGEAGRVPELFTDDGVWASPGTRLVGRDELSAVMNHRQARRNLRSRHVCSTFVCDVIDEDRATGVVYLSLYRREGVPEHEGPVGMSGPAMVGEYRDEFVRTEHGWRINARELIVAFTRDDA
ncbi:MAG: nuclear transport factor 2 family protein [Actinobacteria bacterium]|nr:nuclear transport factor 2 family protein [Actinomycetota bacterium]